MPRQLIRSEYLVALAALPDRCAQLLHVDPPFNTGRPQSRERLRAVADPSARREGVGGRKHRTERTGRSACADALDMPRIEPGGPRYHAPRGGWFVHRDAHEAHCVKVALDSPLGRASCMNGVVWAYDHGARSRARWPAKHDTISWYAMDPEDYGSHDDEIDRIRYLGPDLVGAEEAARGRTPTDVWWHTIVPTHGRVKPGDATQRPLGILNRIIRVHGDPGETVLDFFAGSGTAGEAAAANGRGFVPIDESAEAVSVLAARLAEWAPDLVGVEDPVLARGVQRGMS